MYKLKQCILCGDDFTLTEESAQVLIKEKRNIVIKLKCNICDRIFEAELNTARFKAEDVIGLSLNDAKEWVKM